MACTYDGLIIIFSVEKMEVKVEEVIKKYDGVYRYIRQIAINQDTIALISE